MLPTLTTERLVIRGFELGDVDFLVTLNSDPDVTRYTGDGPVTPDFAREVVVMVQTRQYPFGMGRRIVLCDGQPIGWCGLRRRAAGDIPDLGYRFLKSAWGHGYASEASRAVLAAGFSRADVATVEAVADRANHRSVAVMRRLGMAHHRAWIDDSDGVQCVAYRLTHARWLAR